MKPHIRRTWWEPTLSYVWQMEVQMYDGSIGTLQRLELDEFMPSVDPEMIGIYEMAASVPVN